MFARASSFNALVGMAVDVVSLFMALLSFRGIDTPSLPAQGEQRRPIYFNIDRDISRKNTGSGSHAHFRRVRYRGGGSSPPERASLNPKSAEAHLTPNCSCHPGIL